MKFKLRTNIFILISLRRADATQLGNIKTLCAINFPFLVKKIITHSQRMLRQNNFLGNRPIKWSSFGEELFASNNL